ncbi:ras-related protein RAB1BV-like [Histomonas meleagridis]|uniref:ras-related protein RAB1BV-like n=1 Tax=Histomonas meleagridis TaxID=135588 RepID=UPI00355A6635|nr:ras-related protein RAB1BV-like [Histomonas meleagridis]KAH0806768.1 ras-related protein RAB1BV-like [Histomonas meleagridis]
METSSQENSNEKHLKVVITGDSYVGKTSLLNRHFKNDFTDYITSTTGIDFFVHECQHEEKKYIISVYDTAGQESFKGITKFFYREAAAAICVFDICAENTFDNLDFWIRDFQQNAPDSIVYIAANKIDKVTGNENAVPNNKVLKYAKKKNIKIFFASAKTGENVSQMFESLFNELCTRGGNAQIKIGLAQNTQNDGSCC